MLNEFTHRQAGKGKREKSAEKKVTYVPKNAPINSDEGKRYFVLGCVVLFDKEQRRSR